MAVKNYKEIALAYARKATEGIRYEIGEDGKPLEYLCSEGEKLAAERFLSDLEREDLEFRKKDADLVLGIIERIMVHKQGETLTGKPLVNEPLVLQPWQVFCVYNVIGFYYKGTNERRYKEALIFLPRKSGKTLFIAALAFALGVLERKSGAKIYIVAASQQQACESFNDIVYSLRYRGMTDDFSIRDNSFRHDIKIEFEDDEGRPNGSIEIAALASNPDVHDSFNCNIAIADEIHAFKKAAQYNRFKEAMKAYTNKLMIGITTAGDNVNSFCYRRLEYGDKILKGLVKDDSIFIFIARADQSEDGSVDYTDPLQHQKANPSYGVTIRPEDIMNDALQAQNDPQQRKDFLSRSLNLYTAATRAWFDIDEVRASDARYNWTIDELATLPIDWYGGADLSRMYDLTAAALYGEYEGTDIVITHAWFPITQAVQKADQDQIPLFGWADDGWLTMCNSPTVNVADVVNWFEEMRRRGFKIREVGHDRKFTGEEYFPAMKAAGFRIVDQPQYFYLKSQGFRHIEKAIKDGRFYYCHSEAFEYCISNVRAIEKTDDAVQYEKIQPEHRIDLFDAAVFACIRMAEASVRKAKAKKWFGEE